MKRLRLGILPAEIALLFAHQSIALRAETESIHLIAFARKARPAVMLLVVSDTAGKEADRPEATRERYVCILPPAKQRGS